ncbi:MAG: hypothetical protein QM756_33485 [Polyangiaceae bacterium]
MLARRARLTFGLFGIGYAIVTPGCEGGGPRKYSQNGGSAGLGGAAVTGGVSATGGGAGGVSVGGSGGGSSGGVASSAGGTSSAGAVANGGAVSTAGAISVGGVTSGGASVTSGGTTSAEAGGGGEAGAPSVGCVPECVAGNLCVAGQCKPCGASAQICCAANTCVAGLSCSSNGVCGCGGPNQVCCAGEVCDAGLSCDSSGVTPTCSCGSIGARCCAPATSTEAPTCLGSAVCAGAKCGCIAEQSIGYGSLMVRRTDGTVWRTNHADNIPLAEVMYANGDPLVATQIASGYQIGCAIVPGGNLWCFPITGTLTDSTYLGAGLGSTDSTTLPVRVVTSTSGTPLTGVVQVAAAASHATGVFCAVTSDGSVWCWGNGGNGQLGHGDTSSSNIARKVLDTATTPFTGAAEVRVGYNVACARKTDGTVWCWGINSVGVLGVPSTARAYSYYPIQVPLVGTGTQKLADRLIAGPTYAYCAIMRDGSVQCWGQNASSQASGVASQEVTPTVVLRAAGGTALTGVVDLSANTGNAVCVKTADLQILCWGDIRGGIKQYPSTYVDASNLAVTNVRGNLAGGLYFTYVDSNGRLTLAGSVTGQQLTCVSSP